ncbi:MAG: RNA polymerase sigma factor [Candidatus Staskawiczbacteria bacterium]|nr:RNA polymerase sigma factor [Candidatus Staskawiczbacteria bacterium]
MMGKTDQQLVAEYLRGDEKSLEVLIKKYLGQIYSFTYKRIGNTQEAEDITQETFMKAWRSLKKFDNRKEFRNWIFSIARNTCIDSLRRKKTLLYLETIKERGENDKNLEQIDIAQLLSSTTKRLIPQYQTVLSSYYYDNLNFREISEKTGESINTVKSRFRRAILELRKSISEN